MEKAWCSIVNFLLRHFKVHLPHNLTKMKYVLLQVILWNVLHVTMWNLYLHYGSSIMRPIITIHVKTYIHSVTYNKKNKYLSILFLIKKIANSVLVEDRFTPYFVEYRICPKYVFSVWSSLITGQRTEVRFHIPFLYYHLLYIISLIFIIQ